MTILEIIKYVSLQSKNRYRNKKELEYLKLIRNRIILTKILFFWKNVYKINIPHVYNVRLKYSKWNNKYNWKRHYITRYKYNNIRMYYLCSSDLFFHCLKELDFSYICIKPLVQGTTFYFKNIY